MANNIAVLAVSTAISRPRVEMLALAAMQCTLIYLFLAFSGDRYAIKHQKLLPKYGRIVDYIGFAAQIISLLAVFALMFALFLGY